MKFTASDRKALLGTIIFHGALLVLVMIMGLSAPFPPPPEEGIMVNFGTDEQGSGNEEPIYNDKQQANPTPVQETTPKKENPVLTQNFEDAPSLEKKKETVKKKVEVKPKKETVQTVVKKEAPVKEEPKVNTKALYTGRKPDATNTGGEGVTGGKGNQGSPYGSVDSKNHSPGDSQGTGGPVFSLEGRNSLYLPKPAYNYQESGIVVIEVNVDKDGKVTSAKQGKGSTTQSSTLINAAIKAALQSKFDQKPDAAPIQRGTITYHFILK